MAPDRLLKHDYFNWFGNESLSFLGIFQSSNQAAVVHMHTDEYSKIYLNAATPT